MAQDAFKPRGPTKASQPTAGGANARTTPVFGVVKDNIDPTRSGRLQVYITDFGGNEPDNRDNWISVSYMSPFYGSTVPDAGETGFGKYTENPSSYGMWYAQPDIDSTVICIFVNGDINYGFWIGCVPKAEALTMVPAIGATENIIANEGEAKSYGGATRLPVTNINTNNLKTADSTQYLELPKPVHSYQASIMTQQGVIRDPLRGPISSSSQRETPSRVGWGISTPGRPIYSGGLTDADIATKVSSPSQAPDTDLRVIARRGGHSIVMDDGDIVGRDQLVRIRTAKGHQILMSDDGQTLMILHSNGQSYVELGKEGTVDVYSTNSINLRTQGDLNLHADRNVNIHAAKEFNVQAENIKMNSEQEMNFRSVTNTKINSLQNFTLKSDMAMSFESKGDSSFLSQAMTYINGKKVNLNSGASGVIPQSVKPITIIAHTDTLHDKEKGYAAAPGKLLSITSRAPAHAPWANAGQGVDVKVSLSASDNLPSAPKSDVVSTNSNAINNVPADVKAKVAPTQATVSAQPATPPVSKTLDTNTTGAMLGSAATSAANYYPDAVKNGFQVNTTSGEVRIGRYGMDPTAMEKAGILKPGTKHTVFQLALNSSKFGLNLKTPSGQVDISKVIPPAFFTGKFGATSIQAFISNPAAQASAMVTNFQLAQTALTMGNVLKGKETPEQLAGIVMAGATVGIKTTINAITSKITDGNNKALQMVYAGASAANISQNVTGGLGGISKSLTAMSTPTIGNLLDSTRGVVASAFNGIISQFRPLSANVPQNLKVIAGIQQAAVSAVSKGTQKYYDGAAAKASTLASGLINLPGRQGSMQAVVNKALSATPGLGTVPGITQISKMAANAFANKVSNIKTIPFPNIPSQAGGLLNDAISSLQSQFGAPNIAGASAQLQSAITALASGGTLPIKLPTIGFNTTDRGDIQDQIEDVLGDDRIPIPDFTGEVGDDAVAAVEELESLIDEQQEVLAEYENILVEIENAKKAYYEAEQTLLQGDPELDTLKQAWLDLVSEAEDIIDVLEDLQE